MAQKVAILAAGTNDQSSNASLTTSKLTNTITRLQNEGYEVVLVPPNKDAYGVQYDAAVAAAGLKGVSIHEGVFQNSVPNKLTNNSATLIRNTYPNAFIVGDDNAVLINNGVETPNAVNGRASDTIYNAVNMTDFLTNYDTAGTVHNFEAGNISSYAPPVVTTGQSDIFSGANPVPSTTYSDFTSGLQDFNDYLDTHHHIQEEIVAGSQDTGRAIVKAEYSYTMRELLCGLLAGKGLKLPNIQMCLSANLRGLIGMDGITGALQSALNNAQQAVDQFLDHTSINNVLGRLNGIIAEASSIANMINFCGTPIQPQAIPNMLENSFGSFLGAGQNIVDALGQVIPDEVSACASLGADGKVQFKANIFNGGALKTIGDNLAAIQNGTISSTALSEMTGALNSVADEFGKLIDKETWVNGTGGSGYDTGGSQFTCGTLATETVAGKLYEIETLGTTDFTAIGSSVNTVGNTFTATGPGTGTGCVREVNTVIGVLHNPDSEGVAGNAALAASIKNAYDQVGGYPVVAQDGTIHDNIFEVLLDSEMLKKVRAADDPQSLLQKQNPVYDYCGNVIGYTNITTSGSTERSTGQAPIESTLPGNLSAGDRATSSAYKRQNSISPGIQPSNTGSQTVTREYDAPKIPSLNTTERNQLETVNGAIIYNQDTNKFQGYANGAWTDLDGSGGGGGGGGSAITVQDEGSNTGSAAEILNFTGAGVSVTGTGTTKTIEVTGNSLTVQDEGSALTTAATTFNFTGAGVVASGTGSTKTISIPGGAAQNTFVTVAVAGQSDVTADNATDTLNFVPGTGISIATNAGTDSITFTNTQPENIISQGNSNVTVTDTGSDGTITFDTEGTDRWQFTSAGHLVPVADTTYDIGSATNLVRDIYVSNSSIKFGSSAIPLTVSGSNRLNFNSNQLMENLVDDTTPQLGGTLDANGNTIDMGTNILTDTNLGQFITAYGWGDHSVPGYLTTADVYKQMIVTDTDSGFTYAETGTHTASGLTDTFTFVSGTGIDLDVDTTNGALRISRAGTGASFSQSSFTGDGSDTTFDTGNTNLVDVQVFVNGVLMTPGTDYTFSAATGIITFSVAPLLNDEIYAYEYTETPGSITLTTLGIPNHDKIVVDGSGNVSLDDNEKLKFGNDGDLEIYHDSLNSYIDDTGTGSLFLRSGTTYFQNAGGTKTSIQTNAGAQQTLYHNNTPVFETAATGIYLNGSTIEFEGSSANGFETTLTVTNPTQDNTITLPDATGTVALTSDLTSYVSLTGLSVGAEGTASGDGAIAYDNSTGVFTYTPPTIMGIGGVVADTSPQLGGHLETNGSDIKVADNDIIKIGTNTDLKIQHTDSLASQTDSNGDLILDGGTWTSYIQEVGAGSLIFKTDGGPGTGAYQFYDTGWRPILKLFSGSSARAGLYYAGSEVLVTSTTGVDITGVATAGSFATTNYTDDDGTATLTTTSATTIDTWPATATSGEYVIEASQGSDRQVCKIICLKTSSGMDISVYGILYTGASALVTFTGAAGPVLQATPASASSMTIKWKRTFIN
jgi:hypothetical protein